MKRCITVLFVLALLFGASSLYAQGFVVELASFAAPLDSLCGGSGHPIADGTLVEIMLDLGAAGPSPEDTLVPYCLDPPDCNDGPVGSVNLNAFTFNSAEMGLDPGEFDMFDALFTSSGVLPSPNRFYCRICLPGHHYYSNSFAPQSGYQQIPLTWTCDPTPCSGVPTPIAPSSVVATNGTTCGGVAVSWAYPDTVAQLDSFLVYRQHADVPIGHAGPALRSFFDSSATVQTEPYFFYVKARRHTAGGNAFGFVLPTDRDTGWAAAPPVVPTQITATMGACSTVTVSYYYGSAANTSSFVIRRDADSVGSQAVSAPGYHQFVHHVNATASAQYTVTGWSQQCGYGVASAPATGQAAYRPAQVQAVAATDGGCDSTIITWTDVATETAYQVWRANADGSSPANLTPAGLAANTVRYRDATGTNGQTYRYWLVAVNGCGSATPSAIDSGYRLQTPGTPTGFLATDSTLCDRVQLTWTNVVGNRGYKIVRVGTVTDTLGPVARDTTHFEDLTAVGGQNYSYAVLAYNTCGSSALSATHSGSRRGLPGVVSGVNATDNNCTGVIVTWNNVASEDSFRVMRNGTQIGAVAANILTYTDVSAVAGVTYTYTVVAWNACGPAGVSNSDQGTRSQLPAQVTGVTASQGLCTGVNIGWQTVSGADSFMVYRDANLIAATGSSAISYTDTSVHDAATHNYTVAAKNVCGIGTASLPATGRRLAEPPAIVNLGATMNNCATVIVSWNSAANADSFQIRRDNVAIGVVGPTATSYNDNTANAGTTYSYLAVSYNGCGAGPVPTAVQGRRIAAPVPTGLIASNNRCDRVTLTWQPVPGPVQLYRIYQNSLWVDVVDSGITTRDIHPGGPGNWLYTVTAYSSQCGESVPSDTARGIMQTQPNSVSNVQATTNRCDGVVVTWNPGSGAVDGYLIRRNTVVIDSVSISVLSFFDSTAAVGNSQYQVRPYSIYCNQPSFSPAVTGTRIPMPLAPTNVVASTNQCSRVEITWTDLPDETGYHVYRDSVRIAILAINTTGYYDSTATAGNHNYAVVGINSCGEGARSSAVQGTFNAVPAQVTTLAATQDSCSSITLTWTDVATAQYYRIYRDGALLDSMNQGHGNYVNATLTPGTHTYHLVPVNFCGTGVASTDVTGRVQSPPAQITDLAATSNQCTITVTWSDLANELHYVLYRDSTVLATLPQNTASFVDSTASVGTHHYAIMANNQCGAATLSAYISGTRRGTPLFPPTVNAPDSTCDTATFTWNSVANVDSFYIYRAGSIIATVASSVLTYQASAPPGSYQFAIRGGNACGAGPMSFPFTVLFKTVPAQVVGVTASVDSCTNITLHWTDVSGEIRYRIYRAGTLIDSVLANATQYIDVTATVGNHDYQVSAVNECGEGQLSVSVTGTRLGVPAIVTNLQASDTLCANIVLTWNNVAGETRFVILRDNVRLDSVAADVLTYTDANAAVGSTHAYRVFALNTCGHGDTSTVDNGTRPDVPGQVTGLAASANRCDGINLTWNNLASETRFWIYRRGVLRDSVNADTLHYLDTTAPTDTVTYTVSARNSCGMGLVSVASRGTRLASPGVPSSIQATDTCTMVYVHWGNATGVVDSFKVYRDAVMIREVPVATTSIMDTVAAGTAHAYTVRAHSNLCGDGNLTNAANGTAHASPGVPVSLTAAIATCDSIVLNWTAAPNSEVTRYRIFRDAVRIDSTVATHYRDVAVNDGGNHNYTVIAFNPWCGPGTAAGPVQGHELPLVTVGTVSDTVRCDSTVHVPLTHCTVTSSDVSLSLNGGAYVHVLTLNPVGLVANVPMPDTSHIAFPSCRLRFISVRGARTDTAYSSTFVVDCRLGAADLISNIIPKDYYLDQNYPNPFNPSTMIRFGVPKTSEMRIAVYDVLGRQVAVIVEGLVQPGVHAINWDCSACPSGMYLIRLQTGDRVMMRKMLLMK